MLDKLQRLSRVNSEQYSTGLLRLEQYFDQVQPEQLNDVVHFDKAQSKQDERIDKLQGEVASLTVQLQDLREQLEWTKQRANDSDVSSGKWLEHPAEILVPTDTQQSVLRDGLTTLRKNLKELIAQETEELRGSTVAAAPHAPHMGQRQSLMLSEQAVQRRDDTAAPWRFEVEALQAQFKCVTATLKNDVYSCAMVTTESGELLRRLELERTEQSHIIQELAEALQAEREARTRDKQELVQTIRSEVEARSMDVRELAKSLQLECNARAGEVEQLAKVFLTERDDRIHEVEQMAEELRSEFATQLLVSFGAECGGSDVGFSASDVGRVRVEIEKT